MLNFLEHLDNVFQIWVRFINRVVALFIGDKVGHANSESQRNLVSQNPINASSHFINRR